MFHALRQEAAAGPQRRAQVADEVRRLLVTKARPMPFFPLAWILLLAGFVTFTAALAVSAKGPSRAQMLLIWLGLGKIMASMLDWAIGT